MVELFAGLLFWQLLIIIISLFGGVAGIILLLYKLRIPIKLKNRVGGSLSINDKHREASLKEKITMQKKDLLIILGKVSEVTAKQIDIKAVETLNNQMVFIEDKIGDRTIYDTKFIESLKRTLDPDKWNSINLNEDFLKYTLVVKGALDKIINSFRAACRINHFDEYEEEKFIYYADRKSTNYLQIINEAVENNYILTKFISPEEIKRINTIDLNPKVKKIFMSFFSNARRVSSDSSLQVLELDFVLLDFITNYSGVDITKEEREIFINSIDGDDEKEVRRRMLERY